MDDLAFMKDPDKWPIYPLLPLVNRKEKGLPAIGFLIWFELDKKYAWYEGVSIFSMPKDLGAPHTIGGEELLKELLEKGWVVD